MIKVINISTHLLIITLGCLLIGTSIFAQAPQKMSYQAVIRNTSGALVTSTTVGMKISILQGTVAGTVVYAEKQNASTNANGLVSVEIGSGTIIIGTFSGINWGNGPYFIKTQTDPLGGTNYTIASSSQLMSVPYALFSANGTPGPQGPQGSTGLTGSAGAIGPQGPIGLTGADGADGAQGPIGLTGAVGVTGAQGPIGLTGANGNPGATGPQGPIGLSGAVGATGPIGLSGAVGATGPIGLTGAVGAQGPIGLTGSTGATGTNGTNGTFPPGTVAGEMNYWNGTAWVTVSPGTYGQNLTYCNGLPTWGPCPPLVIGQSHQGGKIAYILQAGDIGYNVNVQHGLIATPSDQGFLGAGPGWGCYGTTITGADGTAIGTGNQNTIDIMNGCSTAGIAARVCGDLVLGGYSDWYLPSKDELYQLCLNRVAIGGFANTNNYYWSSTENNVSQSWGHFFNNSNSFFQFSSDKDVAYGVRAVRAF